MASSEKPKSPVEQAGEDLFNFAIERDDTKWLVARLPAAAEVTSATLEYELQILKIISVGWSIPYFLAEWPEKQQLIKIFWEAVREFAGSLSSTTEMMTGQEIDYFQTLKERLDGYLDALQRHPEATEPAEVIGAQFARACGKPDDLFAVFTGGRMFSTATMRVREYLDAANLQAKGDNAAPPH